MIYTDRIQILRELTLSTEEEKRDQLYDRVLIRQYDDFCNFCDDVIHNKRAVDPKKKRKIQCYYDGKKGKAIFKLR